MGALLELSPVYDGSATAVRLRGAVWTPPYCWQMTELVEMLCEPPGCVCLPANAPERWLGHWHEALDGMDASHLQVRVLARRPRGRRRQEP